MPKGKILMGKKSPKPMPDGKKRALPMPRPKPGKPVPKGGKVFDQKIVDNSQKKFGAMTQKGFAPMTKRGSNKPIGGAGSIKKKPVMPRRGGR